MLSGTLVSIRALGQKAEAAARNSDDHLRFGLVADAQYADVDCNGS